MSVQSYRRDQVVDLINSVISKVSRTPDAEQDAIVKELQDLKYILQDLKNDLGSISAQDVSLKYIPSATDELDAVVKATEQATISIMEACDGINNAFLNGEDVQAHITRIYEACTFQDIAGQRIAKVIGSLNTIDQKVNRLLGFLGADQGQDNALPRIDNADKTLLNGPALPGNAMSQDDIDRLLDGL